MGSNYKKGWSNKKALVVDYQGLTLLRRGGSNSRPSGYEPDELPLLYFAIWVANIHLQVLLTKDF